MASADDTELPTLVGPLIQARASAHARAPRAELAGYACLRRLPADTTGTAVSHVH